MGDMSIYAIGDIHGHLRKLQDVHGWIEKDQQKYGPGTVVHVGDYTDRGPDSRGVVQYLIDGIGAGQDWICLKGNHDRMMAYYLEPEPRRDPRLRAEYDWLHPNLGGIETLRSYGVDTKQSAAERHNQARALVPEDHRRFLEDLPLTWMNPNILIVHAGIRPGVPLDQQEEVDLVWIRDEFHFSRADHGRLVIHGHTPVEDVFHYGNRINIDTGAAYGGPLSAIVWDDGRVFRVTKRGRVELKPPERR